MPYYVVTADDHLDRIAFRAGSSPSDIWDHPANRELKEKRGGGDILHPGDLLFLPAPAAREARRVAAGSQKTFTASVPETRIKLKLVDRGKPLAGEPFVIQTATGDLSGSTDGEGGIDVKVPVRAAKVTLLLPNQGTARELAVGGVDPLGEISGVQTRLKQLGHYNGPIDGAASEALSEALLAFRRAARIRETGGIDEELLAALASQFGC
ncbi:MAG: peptidoglycan-binding domain-containing protein [Polyangiaceae bacterium]